MTFVLVTEKGTAFFSGGYFCKSDDTENYCCIILAPGKRQK